MSFLDSEDRLNGRQIQRSAGCAIPMPELHTCIDSTNIRAKLLAADGAEEGSAVLADAQTAGHGRYGRPFFSGAGQGLYMSVILRPRFDFVLWPQLTTFAALALCESLEALCPSLDLQVKWVNDVYLRGKKLAGILTETVISPSVQSPPAAIVGIGVNLCGRLPEELQQIACTLDSAVAPPSRNLLAGEIIKRLLRAEKEIASGTYLARYRRRCFILSKDVWVQEGGNTYEATVLDLLNDASLLIRLPSGEKRALRAGEVSIRMQGGA
ncbi:MAG: biotin--[Clostridia bacterium]|nr:biotin--[acetyl-CoA-carboxylase] ligase [Clostridia bacterium]